MHIGLDKNCAVRLQNACKSFAEGGKLRTVLDGLDFVASKGELIAITGPSGSGKSTLLNLLGGIDRVDSGLVDVMGTNLTSLSETDMTIFRRHNIGYVFQFFNLVPTLTVAENLSLPLALCNKDAPNQLILEKLAQFGLQSRADAYPDVLSGGEQQRVALIRAAIHQPGLVIADEPTGNLDQQAGKRVLDHLAKIVEQGACVIMVTHSDSAANVAHSRYQLADGKLLKSR